MPIPLVVRKRYEGQRVMSIWHLTTQTKEIKRIRNRDAILFRHDQPKDYSNVICASRQSPRGTNYCVLSIVYCVLYGVLPVFQHLNLTPERTLYVVPKSMVVEDLSCVKAGARASTRLSKVPDPLRKRPRNHARPPLQVGSLFKKAGRSLK